MATLISRNEVTWNRYRYIYNIGSLDSGAASGEHSFDVSPYTVGEIINFNCIGLSTYTISLRDAGGTGTPSLYEILKLADIDGDYSNQGLSIIFNNVDSTLYGIVTNDATGLATGVITLSFTIKG